MSKSHSKFSLRTKSLLERRSYLKQKLNPSPAELVELRNLRKNIAESQKEDIETFNSKKVTAILNSSKSITKAKKLIQPDIQWVLALRRNNVDATNRLDINEVATQFYSELFNTEDDLDPVQLPNSFEKEPDFLVSKIEKTINDLSNEKSGGSDNIKAELLKLGSVEVFKWLTSLFNEILRTTSIPSQWRQSIIILLHKKGDKRNIQNYRPISLISTIYKVFAKCLLERLKPIFEINQPPELAAFRKGFSTIDHLHSINQLIEKGCEYNIPIYFAFIDFTKAFDTINHNSIWLALINQGIPTHFIKNIQEIYENSTAFVKTDTTGKTFPIKRGARQGDPLSPSLFSTVLEEIFRKMNWDEMGININGKWLSNLRFADDIVLISTSPVELQTMLNDLSQECRKVGLEMNLSKTKLMSNSPQIPIIHETEELEGSKEIARRVTNTWNEFWNLNNILKLRLPMQQKKEIFDSSIVSVLNYAAQTRTNNQKEISSINVCQRSMERSLLNVRITDHVRNQELRRRTNFTDASFASSRRLKWDWAGHVLRLQDNRWTSLLTDWIPLNYNRNVGRQMKRWRDELKSFQPNYRHIAFNRKLWKQLKEQF